MFNTGLGRIFAIYFVERPSKEKCIKIIVDGLYLEEKAV